MFRAFWEAIQFIWLIWIIILKVACVLLKCCSLEGHDGCLDYIDTLAELMLFDDEGGGQADDVTMGGLGQQSVVTKA